MNELLLIIISTFILSSITFVSVILLSFKTDLLNKIVFLLVAVAAGTMLGSSFLHLLPEAMELLDPATVLKVTLIAFLGFYLLEKLMHWHHPHNEEAHVHSFGYLNLLGDIIHNFIDGLILASAFVVDIQLGFVTLFALALHEIPQEISDFAILIYAGFSRKKAIIVNFLAGVSSVLGGVIGFYLAFSVNSFIPYLLPIAAGGFIYIATSDLVPEIKKEKDTKRSMIASVMLMLGVALALLIGVVK